MTLQLELMQAILSMDAYNRGYNASIELDTNPDNSSTGFQIGNAIIIIESDIDSGTLGVNAGFYALAYSYNGETIIVYRGTDYPENGTPTPRDIQNGWPLGLGEPDEAPQGSMAA